MFYGHAMLIRQARKDRDIYRFRFIAVASRGYKNWLKIEQRYSDSVLKPDLSSARWMPKLVSIDDQRYAALTLQSLRVTIGPLQASITSSESQESYLTAGMLPYNRNVTLQTFLSSTRDFNRLHSTFALVGNYLMLFDQQLPQFLCPYVVWIKNYTSGSLIRYRWFKTDKLITYSK